MKFFPSRYGWSIKQAVLLVVLVTAAIFAAVSQWQDILLIALNDEESSHIILVVPIAAWLVWIRRIRFRRCPPHASWFGVLIILAGCLLAYLSYQNAFQAGWHAGAVLMLIGAIISVVGSQVVANFAPAAMILVLLVPIPGNIRLAIAGPLQNATARVTTTLLETMGFYVERSGNLVNINDMPVAVAEACNGMRMVFALVLVSYAFAFSVPLRNSVRLMVLLLSPIAAIVCNVIRLAPTVILYGNAPQDIADNFHDIAGWLMLPVAFLMLMGATRALRWAMVPTYRFTLATQSS
ncbi:MAG: exosortase/archaeosortase family protein [Phycisphaerales bacterium]|nr:exosortase/archaeosortase family protein [Phycisphaerales bacterium]